MGKSLKRKEASSRDAVQTASKTQMALLNDMSANVMDEGIEY